MTIRDELTEFDSHEAHEEHEGQNAEPRSTQRPRSQNASRSRASWPSWLSSAIHRGRLDRPPAPVSFLRRDGEGRAIGSDDGSGGGHDQHVYLDGNLITSVV